MLSVQYKDDNDDDDDLYIFLKDCFLISISHLIIKSNKQIYKKYAIY